MRSASTSRISDPRQLYEKPKGLGEETMSEQSRNSGRGYSRAAPAPEVRNLTFMGSDGGNASDRPVVYAKASMGEAPKKAMKQATPAPNHASLSLQEARNLRDAIGTAQPGAEAMFKAKGCSGVTLETFAKLAAIRSRLDNFLSTAKEGNTFAVTKDDLDTMDKVIACAIASQKTPDPWAYVILGAAVAGTVVVMHL